MSIYKVANLFIKKLVLATNQTYQDLASAYRAALALQQLSDVDPYEDKSVTDATAAVARSLGHLVYKADKDPAGVKATDITWAVNAVQNRLSQLDGMNVGSDVRSQSAALRSALSKVQPVDIPARGATYKVPVENATAQPASSGEMAPSYEAPTVADPNDLSNVVKNLAPKANPWDEAAREDWEVDVSAPNESPDQFRQRMYGG